MMFFVVDAEKMLKCSIMSDWKRVAEALFFSPCMQLKKQVGGTSLADSTTRGAVTNLCPVLRARPVTGGNKEEARR